MHGLARSSHMVLKYGPTQTSVRRSSLLSLFGGHTQTWKWKLFLSRAWFVLSFFFFQRPGLESSDRASDTSSWARRSSSCATLRPSPGRPALSSGEPNSCALQVDRERKGKIFAEWFHGRFCCEKEKEKPCFRYHMEKIFITSGKPKNQRENA